MDTTTTTTTTMSPFPILDSAPTTSEHHASIIPSLCSPSDPLFQLSYEGPLYTEINIPLPRIPTSYQPGTTTSSSKQTVATTDRPRGRTLTLSRFRPRSSSSATTTSTSTSTSTSSRTRSSSTTTTTSTRPSSETTRPRKDTIKSREVNAMMDLRHQSKKTGRNGAIDALAVVPAVLVLSAELFTPGSEKEQSQGGGGGRRKDSGVGRWEDGIR